VNVLEFEDEISVLRDYEIIICQGCKEVSFRTTSSCSEDMSYNPETGETDYDEDIKLYPSRIAGRKQVKDMYLLPEEVLKIYKETPFSIPVSVNDYIFNIWKETAEKNEVKFVESLLSREINEFELEYLRHNDNSTYYLLREKPQYEFRLSKKKDNKRCKYI